MKSPLVSAEIAVLETYSKQGESYTNAEGRYGWRNPIRSDTGPLLTALTLARSPKRMLEIGTGHGLSTLYLASGMNAHATMDSIELDSNVAASTQQRMDACRVAVTVHAGDALQVIPKLKGTYELVFIDGQKSHYHHQLMALLQYKLVGSGTLVLADNVTDRYLECASFLDWFVSEGIPHEILTTECGLLVATLK